MKLNGNFDLTVESFMEHYSQFVDWLNKILENRKINSEYMAELLKDLYSTEDIKQKIAYFKSLGYSKEEIIAGLKNYGLGIEQFDDHTLNFPRR